MPPAASSSACRTGGAPARGATIQVRGAVADPYGQLEVRPASTGFTVTGHGSLPAPVRLNAADLGEATEGRLVELSGTVAAAPTKGTSGDFTVDSSTPGGPSGSVRRLEQGRRRDLAKGKAYRVTGIVGQRATRKGALDGYRLSSAIGGRRRGPRHRRAPAAAPGGSVVADLDSARVRRRDLLNGRGNRDGRSGPARFSGRRIVVQDASGAIEVLLPAGSRAPGVGARFRIAGRTGHA